MKYVKGDLIAMARGGEFDIIIHGCNCFCRMKSGFAKHITEEWGLVREVDSKTTKGSRLKLGSYSAVEVGGLFEPHIVIINAYTQYGYSRDGDVFEYDALKTVLGRVVEDFGSCRIGLPKIGSGLAGGDWGRIASIIEEQLDDKFEVTIVEFG